MEPRMSLVAWKYRCSVSTSTPSLSQKMALVGSIRCQTGRLRGTTADPMSLAYGLGVERPDHRAHAVRGGPIGMLQLKLGGQHRRGFVSGLPLGLHVADASLERFEHRALLRDQRSISDRAMRGDDHGGTKG